MEANVHPFGRFVKFPEKDRNKFLEIFWKKYLDSQPKVGHRHAGTGRRSTMQ